MQSARKNEPGSAAMGYLHLKSPYMNRASVQALSCLHAALEEGVSADLYAYLDGVHAGHIHQKPSECRNIGEGLEELDGIARKRGLQFQVLACERSAAARGYSTWDDGRGVSVSACTIGPMKIRNLAAIASRFALPQIILGESVAAISMKGEERKGPDLWLEGESSPPPVLILITRSPYDTGYTFGGLSLAIACAYQGIADTGGVPGGRGLCPLGHPYQGIRGPFLQYPGYRRCGRECQPPALCLPALLRPERG